MPLTVLPSGQIVSDAPAPENLDTIEELAASHSALTNTVGFVVAGAPSDANSLERLNNKLETESARLSGSITAAGNAIGAAQDNARNLAIADLIGTAPDEGNTLGELYNLIPAVDDTLPLDSISTNPVESQAIAEAIKRLSVDVIADMTITALTDLGGDPLLLADNQIVVLRQFGLSDISGYVDSRPSVAPVGNKDRLWDGNPNSRINAASFSWQQFATNLVRPLFFRRMTMNTTVGRAGGFHRIANFVSQNGAGEVSRTFRDVTRGLTNSLWFVDSTGSDIYVTAEAWVEADAATIQVDGQTATVGSIVAIPEALATTEAPAGLYRYAQDTGRAYRLVPVERTLIEYDNGKLELSEAPSAETTAAAYTELTARLQGVEEGWFVFSADPPDMTQMEWKIWAQFTEADGDQIYARSQGNEPVLLNGGGQAFRSASAAEPPVIGGSYSATEDVKFAPTDTSQVGQGSIISNDGADPITVTPADLDGSNPLQFLMPDGTYRNELVLQPGDRVYFELNNDNGHIMLARPLESTADQELYAQNKFYPAPVGGLVLGRQYFVTAAAAFADVRDDQMGETVFIVNDGADAITLTAPDRTAGGFGLPITNEGVVSFLKEDGESVNTFEVQSGETVGFRLAAISGSIVLKEFPNEASEAPQVYAAISDLPDVTTQRNGAISYVFATPVYEQYQAVGDSAAEVMGKRWIKIN